MADLQIAEIPYENGKIKFRYSRYLSSDESRWIRYGLFVAYHPNGKIASEGNYEHGSEQGLWRDFHENGKLAAEGEYQAGEQIGNWKYWNNEGVSEG
ncbi:toxin-antitoxin system YwqK family antitoxin [Pseudomonas mangrovi]|uniref:Toxin-antitoxin system YwqK family antitoxin n=1 Tax=Pseudomonas mangrovi TaxID=2161748 RepID=A0A2T5P4R2_9PSED|nr:hypothetical protein [Pseudomonas mangrovi]PTU72731.1 hypothetical protein DBO85_18425 [Pseudomonas mangrovi]